ncbi:MAG: hypothetical protein JST14_11155 [Bacteroidetes bacterium]|nr:hypothetical protein [Bacteroidota bacterium]MBS1977830.1 hypothetical protein [Bacteroidota bacterium]
MKPANGPTIFAVSLSVAGEIGKGGKLDYEFKNLEDLIQKATGSARGNRGKSTSPRNLTLAISKERDQLEERFDLKFLVQVTEKERTRFIQFHQFSLTRLINSCSDLFKRVNIKTSPWEGVVESITSLFQFLTRRYFRYLDLSYSPPVRFVESMLAQQSDKKGELERLLDELVNDDELREVCKNLINIHLEVSQTTLGKAFFIIEARRRLAKLFSRQHSFGTDLINEIRNELLRLNFNSDEFLGYYTRNISNDLTKLDSDRERFESLAWHFKNISQIQNNGSAPFDKQRRPIKQSVSEWIIEEMNFIEAKFRLNPIANARSSEPALGDFKLTLDLSVAQLALLIKSFVETGVIQNKNISELIRFLSRFAVTKKSGSVSQESLRIKYYNVETGTKDSIRNMLHTAIGYINNN